MLSRLEAVQTALKPSSSIEGRQEEATYLPVATVQPWFCDLSQQSAANFDTRPAEG